MPPKLLTSILIPASLLRSSVCSFRWAPCNTVPHRPLTDQLIPMCVQPPSPRWPSSLQPTPACHLCRFLLQADRFAWRCNSGGGGLDRHAGTAVWQQGHKPSAGSDRRDRRKSVAWHVQHMVHLATHGPQRRQRQYQHPLAVSAARAPACQIDSLDAVWIASGCRKTKLRAEFFCHASSGRATNAGVGTLLQSPNSMPSVQSGGRCCIQSPRPR